MRNLYKQRVTQVQNEMNFTVGGIFLLKNLILLELRILKDRHQLIDMLRQHLFLQRLWFLLLEFYWHRDLLNNIHYLMRFFIRCSLLS